MTLIKREDAIEAVLTYFIPRSHTGERGEHEEDFVRTIFKALPSAELTLQTPQTHGKSINPSNAEVVEDYISRADAIEAVCKAVCEDDVSIFPECDQIKYCDEIQALLALPSAEAVEVVRCKDCKASRVYGKTTQWLACEDVMEGQATDPDGYCYLGERREP